LGVFDLHRVIGRGAAGEVWEGIHRGQGVPVAVKVLGAHRAQDESAQEAFRAEVRAVAGMTHPGIIMLFDHGTVDTRAALTSHGNLIPRSPYLVMELASGGALGEVEFRSWSQVRYVLFSLLDALGHAHARDVLHRDLKPGNVVICGEEDPRPGLKLTDFGIARAFESRDDEGEVEVTGGTPRYMAPEQFRGRFREAGPWTDLYALGCIAYQLVSGSPPFDGTSSPALAAAHMLTPPPALVPSFAVPEGVEAWIGRLLEKRPRDRYRRAADAARDLLPLGSSASMPVSNFEASFRGERLDLYEVATIQTTPISRSVPAFDPMATVVTSFRDEFGEDGLSRSGVAAGLNSDATHIDVSAQTLVPETWRAPIVERPSLKLVGAGLGLFGFRAIPLVGRLHERDAIWSALRAVSQNGVPHAMVIEGAPGVGKTRLVEWVAARGHELGAATVLRATHGELPAADHGLGRMLARHLRCVGLEYDKALAHIQRALEAQSVTDPYEWRGLATLADGVGAGPGRVRFHDRVERYALIRRHLLRLSQERPVVVWLDDVQWGPDAVAFVRYMLAEQSGQVLFLLTHRGGQLPELDGIDNV
jgi:serine/threonine protein kinase